MCIDDTLVAVDQSPHLRIGPTRQSDLGVATVTRRPHPFPSTVPLAASPATHSAAHKVEEEQPTRRGGGQPQRVHATRGGRRDGLRSVARRRPRCGGQASLGGPPTAATPRRAAHGGRRAWDPPPVRNDARIAARGRAPPRSAVSTKNAHRGSFSTHGSARGTRVGAPPPPSVRCGESSGGLADGRHAGVNGAAGRRVTPTAAGPGAPRH